MYKKLIDLSGVISNAFVQKISDGAVIPFDLGNTDYQDYLTWLEEDENKPLPADEPNQ